MNRILSTGLYRFKKGFGAEFTEFIGELYIPFRPVTYKLYQVAEKLYKKVALSKGRIKKQ